MFILLLLIELLIAATFYSLLLYKELFNNLFNLVSTIVLIAFLPNFLTSLLLLNNTITIGQSQIIFSITGAIVYITLWRLLKNYQC